MADAFIDMLDRAARSLLKEAGLSGKDDTLFTPPLNGETATAVLAEKVKAFTAVVQYVDKRATLAPKPKEPSKFETIRQKMADADTKKPRKAKSEEAKDEAVD
jgi:hypothetical protein